MDKSTTRKRRPTRRDLLVVIDRLQNLVGWAMARNNDRNNNRHADVDGTLDYAHRLCVAARSQDPPFEGSGPWAAPEDGDIKRFI